MTGSTHTKRVVSGDRSRRIAVLWTATSPRTLPPPFARRVEGRDACGYTHLLSVRKAKVLFPAQSAEALMPDANLVLRTAARPTGTR